MSAAEQISSIAQNFPAVTSEIKWEVNNCFLIGGKIFALRSLDEPFAITVKVTEEDFELLIEITGITQAPYFKRNQWVKITSPNAFSRQEWEAYLHKAYQLVFAKLTKKLQAEINAL